MNYVKHLQKQKEDCKKYILDIIQERKGLKFSSANLQYAVNTLKEIEIIEEFISSDDFDLIIKDREGM